MVVKYKEEAMHTVSVKQVEAYFDASVGLVSYLNGNKKGNYFLSNHLIFIFSSSLIHKLSW